MKALELRPMGIGDILDATFRLYRRRFLTFLIIALVVYVPYALLMTIGSSMQTAPVEISSFDGQPELGELIAAQHNTGGGALMILGAIVFGIFVFPLCTAALVHNISAGYLGEELSAGQSYSRAAPRLLSLIWAQILSGVVIFLGFLLLIVPGIIFSLWFLLIVPVVVLEGVRGSSALGRSRELMRGNLGKGFLLMIVVGILSMIISLALNSIIELLPIGFIPLRTFLAAVLPAILLPIQTAPVILLYYDLRIRKEAFDLQKLSEALVQPEAT